MTSTLAVVPAGKPVTVTRPDPEIDTVPPDVTVAFHDQAASWLAIWAVKPPVMRVSDSNVGTRPASNVVTDAVVADAESYPARVVVTVAFTVEPPGTPLTVSRPEELIDTDPTVAVPRQT